MVVLILENVPTRLRGELSRWMIEPHAGVFVGSVSGMVRDKLWEEAKKSQTEGGATLAYNSNTEQGFAVRTFGKTRREIVELEGLMLVRVPARSEKPEKVAGGEEARRSSAHGRGAQGEGQPS